MGMTLTDIIFLVILVFLVFLIWHIISGEFYRSIDKSEEYKKLLHENRQLKYENAQLRAELDYPEHPSVSVTYKGRWD